MILDVVGSGRSRGLVRHLVRPVHGHPWEFLPQEMGYGSGMTCWRRLRDWHEAGVWQRLFSYRAALVSHATARGSLSAL